MQVRWYDCKFWNALYWTRPMPPRPDLSFCAIRVFQAGGTGITPMLQVLNAIFTNPGDPSVKVKMIYANQTPDDILVREELEALAAKHPDRFQLWYTVDRVEDKKWKYDTGFITKEMIEKQLLFEDRKNTQFFMCGYVSTAVVGITTMKASETLTLR